LDADLAAAQTLKYAEELRDVYAEERSQRRRAEEALERLGETYVATVRALAAALDCRDDQTGSHADRVASLGLVLARAVGPGLAAEPELEYGFLLHDIGKIGIPDAILLKPGKLDEREMEEMRYHPILGERIVAKVPHLGGVARQVVASHHERWDGTGYPRRLVGNMIPLAARIFAIVDTYDAMTNDRPYRKAVPSGFALAEIARCAGKQFDPALVDVFRAVTPKADRAA
jgi:ribonuclease P protein subunit RPR2